MSDNILLVAAHPDDEVIGCGGTIAKHKKNGDKIHLVYLTDGIGSRDKIEQKQKDIRNSGLNDFLTYFKPASYATFNFPDNAMDSIPLIEITKRIEKIIQKIKPQIIYTHSEYDLNIDHRVTLEAVKTATRPQGKHIVKEIYSFYINSSSDWSFRNQNFNPDVYIDVSKEIKQKEKFLNFYKSEMRPSPHPRSIDNILNFASVNGSTIGVRFAEAFETIRVIK